MVDAVVDEVLAGGGEMGELMRAFDWASTPLGAVAKWPRTLRTVLGILLTTRHPMFLWWGPELIQFYNDGFRRSLSTDLHPSALGQRGRECWPLTWDTIGPQIEAVMERGEATWHDDHLVPLLRGGRIRDSYWSYSYSPVRDDRGGIGGVLVTMQETTQRVLADRQQRILRELAACETEARSEAEACEIAVTRLAQEPADLPFVRLFLREPGTRTYRLGGEAGAMPEGLAAAQVMLPDARSGLWPIGGLLTTTGPLVINESAAQTLWRDATPGPEPVQQAMILPIAGERRDPLIDGVLVAGVSPRLPLDQAYRDFLTALGTQVGRGIAHGRAYDDARGRAEALDGELSRLAGLFADAPGFLAVLRGPDHVFELTNPSYNQLTGHRDLVGRPAREALPEVVGQGFLERLDDVYRTGEPFVGTELSMQLQPRPGATLEEHYFNFVYQAMRTADGAVWGILAAGYDVTEQVRARETAERLAAERDAERRQLLTVLEQSPLAIVIAEAPSGRWIYANPKFAEVCGVDALPGGIESYNESYRRLHPDGRPLAPEEWPLARAIRRGEVIEQETVVIGEGSGRRVEISVNAAPVRDAEGRIIAGVAFFQDVTVERRRDQQLQDAQRLQSVGTLAGGVAHEINNQMTVVLNFSEFILEALGPDHPQASDVRTVLQAGHRAARVSQQLLAFTRRQVSQPRDVALSAVTADLAPVLRRLLGSDKMLELLPPRSAWLVHADRGQIEQVLINLVANARDATSTGGHVWIALEDVAFAGAKAQERGFVIPPGDYVLLTVADNGHGMDPRTLARVFEPFYTTKRTGEGTGLGLSMVYGIVKQHGGYIVAESTPREGTVFKLYLPATATERAAPHAGAEPGGVTPSAQTLARRSATKVLVVEDELAVRRLMVRTLEREGYAVLSAPDGAAALELVRKDPNVGLVITDVIMPHLNGRQLRDALVDLRPALPVVFISGHTADTAVLRELLPPGAPFLQKPFTPADLAAAVAALVEQRP